MKFKKLLISASAIAAGSGILATVLTSCAKANIDSKLRVELDSEGKLYKPGKMETKTFTWKDVVTRALTRSTNWATFKTAVADEIVASWYEDRASKDKNDDKKNSTFRTNIDEWNYQIDKDYNTTIQNCKNKYGANWEFYLQNEYLAPNGGTEKAYKRNKLVEKIKTDFISKVFEKDYFSYRDGNEHSFFPHTFTAASKDVAFNTLKNPANWGNIGFYARADLSYKVTDIPQTLDKINNDILAKYPEGDYAAIQDYVFNRWFDSEKPFFSDAALFKYSAPARVAGGKLDQIYNATRTGVKLPDKPNEPFPFFGAGDDASTRLAVDFLTNLAAGNYAQKYTYQDGQTYKTKASNGTITISSDQTEDKNNTVLLVSGNQMFGSLYTPYAMACGSLYSQMVAEDDIRGNAPNILTAAQVTKNINSWQHGVIDDFAILSNFFYKTNRPTLESGCKLTKLLDLNDVYGGLTGDGTEDSPYEYHCPLFSKCETYPYFYGDTNATGYFVDEDGVYWSNKTGVRYITNNIQVNDFKYSSEAEDEGQPWILELNETGVHFQTIDGYNYIRGDSATGRLDRAKQVVKFRLMQKQVNDPAAKIISTDLLGSGGKLKTYFTDNYANIIIELAQQQKGIFRKVSTYNVAEPTQDDLFLKKIFDDEKLGNSDQYSAFIDYLNKLVAYEVSKKTFENLDSVNSKIFSYRSKQITNSKSKEDFSRTIFENGLLAPFVYGFDSTVHSTRDYSSVNRVVVQGFNPTIFNLGYNAAMAQAQQGIDQDPYVIGLLSDVQVDGDSGFSPQIATAKSKMSNRFWYKSRLVDKSLAGLMGNKAATSNQIKLNAYKYYVDTKDPDKTWFDKKFADPAATHAFATTFKKNKLMTGEKNLSNYVKPGTDLSKYTIDNFYTTMDTEYTNYLDKDTINNGASSDENLNLQLFKATLMYLVGHEKEQGQDFDNFYTLINSKVSEDEEAIVGYMAKGYTNTLSSDAIQYMSEDGKYDYDFDPNVDNAYDQFGYAGGNAAENKGNTKMSTAGYWTAAKKTIKNITRGFNDFLGIQTKANNSLDSGSKLQSTVFDTFARAIDGAIKLDESTEEAATKPTYGQNDGCWFKFGGKLDNNLNVLKWDDFTYDDGSSYTTCKADEWFPYDPTKDAEYNKYAPVRKIAKKIIECSTFVDLRSIAKTLGDTYEGYSYFQTIGGGQGGFTKLEQMKMAMLKLLPSKLADEKRTEAKSGFDKSHLINTFTRVKNAEAHTDEVNPSVVFKDSKAKTSFKLLLTQINKADIVEHNLTPTWDKEYGKWVQNPNSPITPEEFWIILFNFASESTVQQRVINEVVKNAFGDEKLIVYDAQLYNQFDSVWIKDWTKKTMGA